MASDDRGAGHCSFDGLAQPCQAVGRHSRAKRLNLKSSRPYSAGCLIKIFVPNAHCKMVPAAAVLLGLPQGVQRRTTEHTSGHMPRLSHLRSRIKRIKKRSSSSKIKEYKPERLLQRQSQVHLRFTVHRLCASSQHQSGDHKVTREQALKRFVAI